MLVLDPAKRIRAGDAMNSDWIIENIVHITSASAVKKPLENLKMFQVKSMLKNAVLTYMASQSMDPEQLDSLKRSFASLDKNNDGQLSKEELIQGYILQNMSPETAVQEVNEIFEYVDLNHNGLIDYNGMLFKCNNLEFLVANLKKQQVSSEKNLREAFEFFDQKKMGYITSEDLKRVFCDISDEETIEQLIKEADTNGDGIVSFDEFKMLMSKSFLGAKSL